jgi:hypothetical protein
MTGFQRGDGTVRRSATRASGRPSRDVVVALDERHHFARDELDVLTAERPRRVRIAVVCDRQVFARPLRSSVVDADDHERRNPALRDQPVDRFSDSPGVPPERTRRIEQVLPVVQIQNRQGRRADTAWWAHDGDASAGLKIFTVENVDVQRSHYRSAEPALD